MNKNNRFIAKNVLMICLCAGLLGAENIEKSPKSEYKSKELTQEKNWRIFGSIGTGVILGIKNKVGKSHSPSEYYVTIKNEHDGGLYLEVDLGTEFIFSDGNGFNVLLDIDNQAFAIGGNYVYELTGKHKFAFITGLDMGVQYLKSGRYNQLYNTAPLMRYNLGVRYRGKRHAVGINTKIPLYNNTLRYKPSDIFDFEIKNYAGVVVSIAYSYFFRI